jgi:hypothetical protein
MSTFNCSLTTDGHHDAGLDWTEMGFGISVAMRRIGLFAGMSLCLLLGACGNMGHWAVADAAIVIGTDKTFTDHVISLASGKDCSLVRKERGMTYCKEDEVVPRPNVYCYRELGGVSCYDGPDLRRQDRGRLGNNDHNLVKKN